MKLFVALSALMAVASAGQLYYAPGQLLTRAAYQPAVQQQYHAQDEFGQYSYGYSEPLSAKQEVKTLDGVTRGSYSYQDANGKLQNVDYISDAGGFRVSATNLPKPVEAQIIKPAEAPLPVAETPEVAAARSAHLVAIEEAKAREASFSASASAPAPYLTALPVPAPAFFNFRALPRQVEDTPAVALAKKEHFKDVESIKQRDAIIKESYMNVLGLPRQVEDTPEVALAKKEHFNAVENIKLRNDIIKNANEFPAPFRYISSAQLPYGQVILPSGFSYSYRLDDGSIIPDTRFWSSQISHQ